MCKKKLNCVIVYLWSNYPRLKVLINRKIKFGDHMDLITICLPRNDTAEAQMTFLRI